MKFGTKELKSSTLLESPRFSHSRRPLEHNVGSRARRLHPLRLTNHTTVDIGSCARHRRVWSNQRYFLGDAEATRPHAQITATLQADVSAGFKARK